MTAAGNKSVILADRAAEERALRIATAVLAIRAALVDLTL
jgi:hypothetical protein